MFLMNLMAHFLGTLSKFLVRKRNQEKDLSGELILQVKLNLLNKPSGGGDREEFLASGKKCSECFR